MKSLKIKKLDLSGVKNYLFQKGERIALVLCSVLSLLLLGMGIMKAMESGTSYAKSYMDARTTIEKQIKPVVDDGKPPVPPPWVDDWAWVQRPFDQTLMVPFHPGDDNKRRNPNISKVMDDPKHIQVDFLRGGYFSYQLEIAKERVFAYSQTGNQPANPNKAALSSNMAKIMKPLRAVLVTAVFPMKEQMEEYRRKLYYPTMADLVAKPQDLPKPLGLNVIRWEVKPDGKYGEGIPIYKYNLATGKIDVPDTLKNFFREAIIDESNPKIFGKHLKLGLVTPVPVLANLEYPKVNLQGLKVSDEGEDQPRQKNRPIAPKGGVVMPTFQKSNPTNPQGGNANVPKGASVPWQKLQLPPDLLEKFTGNIDYFSPDGILEIEDKQGLDPTSNPNFAMMRKSAFSQAGIPVVGEKVDLFDAIVRFIDVDVEPGKTYVYGFQVVMANPNYQNKDVAFQALADIKTLAPDGPQNLSYTKPTTIPNEFYIYAMDAHDPNQQPKTPGSDTQTVKADKSDTTLPYGKWTTAVQIHRWLDKVPESTDYELTVADWAIAERLVVRRGDTVGRHGVMTEVPVWKRDKGDFEIGYLAQAIDTKRARATSGLPIDYIRDNPPPLLVDFEGGIKNGFIIGGKTTTTRDESAVDMLILDSNGKLVVRNSRKDNDPENPVSIERKEHFDHWLKEIKLHKNAGNAGPEGVNNPR
jgi:hypothetical protein